MQTYLVLSIDYEADVSKGRIDADFIPARDAETAMRIAAALGRDPDWAIDLEYIEDARNIMLGSPATDHKMDLRCLAGLASHRHDIHGRHLD